MLDAKGNVLYVGKARSLRKRVASYVKTGGHIDRIGRMMALILRHQPERFGLTMDGRGWVDLDGFVKPNVRPDGTPHKFDVAYKDHPRKGYIGLQDHGSPCWYW